ELRQVVVDEAHDLGAQALQIADVVRVDDAELLPEHAITYLDGGPGGEVVRIDARQGAVAEEAAVGVEVDAVERHLVEVLEELSLVVGPTAEDLAQLPAAEEVEGRPCRPLVQARHYAGSDACGQAVYQRAAG